MAQRDDDGNAAAVLVDLAEENARLIESSHKVSFFYVPLHFTRILLTV
jgi:hypothetical protein